MHTLAYGRGTLGRSPCFVYYAERGVVACHTTSMNAKMMPIFEKSTRE